jgi:hypothetical protein
VTEPPDAAPAVCEIPAAAPPPTSPVTSEQRPSRRLRRPVGLADALAWLVVALVAVNRLALVPPWMPHNGIDAGWQMALNHAFLHGSVFGRDIVFAFGPLGFLHWPLFDPALYGWCVLFGAALALVVATNVTVLARRARIPPALAALWGVVLVLIAGPDADGRFYLLCFLAAWIGIDEHDRPSRLLLVANAVVLAVVSLAKLSHATGIVLLVLLVSLRNGPLTLGVYVVSVVALWLAAGQPIDAFVAFIRGSLELMTGYSEINVEDGPVSEIITYVTGAIALVILLAMRASRSRGPWRWMALAYTAFLLAVIFRHSFTLHLYHSLTGSMGLMLASVIAAGACWEWRRTPLEVGLVLLAIGAIGFTATSRWNGVYTKVLSPPVFVSETVGYLPRLGGLLNGWRDYREQWDTARQRLADDHPLPPAAKGSVDVLGWQTAIAMTSALPWRPKPVPQQYLVGSPALAALNASYVASNGADTLLADVTTIGQRPPMLDTGPLLLEVIRHYAVADLPGEFLVLRRRDEPRVVELEPQAAMDVRLDQRVAVPTVDSPLWVRIDVEPTLMGRLRGAVLKRPKLLLDLELADGSTRRFTIFPTMTRSGFLLSPLVVNANGLGAVLTGDASVTSGYAVRALTLREAEPSGSYAEPIHVSFAALHFPLDATPPGPADASVSLPLSTVAGWVHLRLRADASGLVAQDIAPGASIHLPPVAASTPETMRWLEVDVEVAYTEELRLATKTLDRDFSLDRDFWFQVSPGRHRLRVPLPISRVPAQVRVDPAVRPGRFRIAAARLYGVDPAATSPPLVRLGEITADGAPGWFEPMRTRANGGRPRADRWAFQPVVAAPVTGPSEPLSLAGARPIGGSVIKPSAGAGKDGTLSFDFPRNGGGVMLAEIAPRPRTPRVLEAVVRSSTPAWIRSWWQPGNGETWDLGRSVGAFVGPTPTIVHVPVPGGPKPVPIRLEVTADAAGSVQVSDARLVQNPPASDH